MTRAAARLAAALLALAPTAAAAQEFTVQINEAAANAAGVDPAAAESELNSAADTTLKVGEQLAFMDQMARATALSTRGMGVDYATNPEKFVFGFSVGSAVSGAGPQFSRGGIELPEGGFAGSMSAMAGLNLGMKADEQSFARRVRLYANGFFARPVYEPFRGTVINYGGHLQFQVLRPRDGEVVEWGGLALTSGYQQTLFRMDLQDQIPIDTGDIRWDADGTYVIDAAAQTVPVEVSTNLRVLVATAFVGAAADINLTNAATSELSLEGDIAVSANDATIGSAALTLEESGVGDVVVPRVFVGLQADIFFVKAYGQVNIGLNDSFGGHLGMRVAM